jgi:hypothetical protein
VCSSVKRAGVRVRCVRRSRFFHRAVHRGVGELPARLARSASGVDRPMRAPCRLFLRIDLKSGKATR